MYNAINGCFKDNCCFKPSLPLILIADAQNNIISKGSGFIFQQEGLVVTCAHVVREVGNGTSAYLQFPDNEEFIAATVAITDHDHDIALLKFQDTQKRKPLRAAKSEATAGAPVIFSGYPLTLTDLTTHQGIISAVIKDPTGMKRYLIDGTVNPGNSGGPLLTPDGEVIGVVDATRRESNSVLSKVQAMKPGALSLHGLDLVKIYNALVNNLQLGVGYAVPSAYIPHYPDEPKSSVPKEKVKK